MNIHTSEIEFLKTEVQRLSAPVRAQQITIDKLEAQLEQCQCPNCKVTLHASDCAVHSGPAYPAGGCDCGAQPEQEPVTTDWERIARVQDAKLRAMCNEAGGFEKLCEVMDKYERTTPPQRKPLTDEQRSEIAFRWRDGNGTASEIIDMVEVAHNIKE